MGIALVTGAGSGIGRATAILLSKNGFDLILVGRNRERLENVHTELSTLSYVQPCDLSKPDESERLAQNVREICQKDTLDVIVNNAGIFARRSLVESDDDLWRSQWEVNLLGPVRLTRLLLPILQKQKSGSIINISSTLGQHAAAGTGAYAAAKAALINWTQCLALEVAPFRIRANCICPGLVETPIHGFEKMTPAEREARQNQMGGMQPLGRIGKPEEIAQAILYFCGPQSEWTTGSILAVDGGISLT